MSKVLRRASGLPAITNCGVADGPMAEAALTPGAADAVAVGRPILAHPDWICIVRSGVGHPSLEFDQKYVIRSPLDFGLAYPTGPVDSYWPAA